MIETERQYLRPILSKDCHAVFSYRSDKSANKYQGWIPENLQEVEDFIAKNPETFNQPDTWFQLVIIEKCSKELIGDIGVHFCGKENKQVEIGCTLNSKHQGNGHATEALTHVMEYLFTVLDKHRIITSIDPNNTTAINLVERLGFRKEAHFAESLFSKGKWIDDLIYACLKKEWKLKK